MSGNNGNMGLGRRSDETLAERAAKVVWLTVLSRVAALVIAPFAVWIFIDFIGAIRELNTTIADIQQTLLLVQDDISDIEEDMDDHENKDGHTQMRLDYYRLNQRLSIVENDLLRYDYGLPHD